MKSKNVLVFLAIIIVLIATIFVIKKTKKNKNFNLENIANIEYMSYMENNKYGVINKNGDVIISAEYDEIDIPNPSKPLFICKYDYDESSGEYHIRVFNNNKESILYQYFIVNSIKLEWDGSEIPYEKSVLKYKQKGKYGLIDFNGKVITKPKYDEINSLDFQEGLLLVKKKGKYGVINIKGDYILKEKYDIIRANENFHASKDLEKMGFVVGNLTSSGYKYGYVNYKNQKILNIEYDQIEIINSIDESNTYFIAFKDGKAGFYNNRYNILKNVYDDIIYNDYNNCLVIEKDGKQGIFKINGEMLLPIEYDNIFISGRYINARKEDGVEVYDFDGLKRINIENVIGLNETIENDKYVIAISSNEKYQIIDVKNNKLNKSEYDYLEYIGNDDFIAYKEGKFGIVDVNGNNIVKFIYDDLHRLKDTQIIQATKKVEGKAELEYIDFSGNIVEYNNSLYPDSINNFKKVELGYGQPYYIKVDNS